MKDKDLTWYVIWFYNRKYFDVRSKTLILSSDISRKSVVALHKRDINIVYVKWKPKEIIIFAWNPNNAEYFNITVFLYWGVFFKEEFSIELAFSLLDLRASNHWLIFKCVIGFMNCSIDFSVVKEIRTVIFTMQQYKNVFNKETTGCVAFTYNWNILWLDLHYNRSSPVIKRPRTTAVPLTLETQPGTKIVYNLEWKHIQPKIFHIPYALIATNLTDTRVYLPTYNMIVCKYVELLWRALAHPSSARGYLWKSSYDACVCLFRCVYCVAKRHVKHSARTIY